MLTKEFEFIRYNGDELVLANARHYTEYQQITRNLYTSKSKPPNSRFFFFFFFWESKSNKDGIKPAEKKRKEQRWISEEGASFFSLSPRKSLSTVYQISPKRFVEQSSSGGGEENVTRVKQLRRRKMVLATGWKYRPMTLQLIICSYLFIFLFSLIYYLFPCPLMINACSDLNIGR